MKRRTPLNLETLEGRALLSGLSYSLTTNQSSYQTGQPVVMTFQETNVSNQVIQVEDGPSIDGFNVTQGGKVIWRSNAGVNPMFIVSDPLQPGQSLTLTATWNGVPNGGSSPVSGTFVITNQLDPTASATVAISGAPVKPVSNPAPPTTNPQPIGVVPSPDPVPSQPVKAPTPVNHSSGSPISNDPSTTPSTTVAESSPIAVSVSTDQPSYHRGHRVRMTMTLQDVSNTPVSLPINSTQEFTLLEGSKPVWREARLVSGVGSVNLNPGQLVKFTAVWNGKVHQAGVPLGPGIYTLQASAEGYSGSTTFRVTA
jgi:hypothetical protein